MYNKNRIQELQTLTHLLLSANGKASELRDVLRFHEYRYYVLNDPLISDKEYDELYKIIKPLDQLKEYFTNN